MFQPDECLPPGEMMVGGRIGRQDAGSESERSRMLRQSVEILNHLFNSNARPESERALRQILRARAYARMSRRPDKNSLPGLS